MKPTEAELENALTWARETPLEDWEAPAVLARAVQHLRDLCHRTAAHLEYCNMVTREEEALVEELKSA